MSMSRVAITRQIHGDRGIMVMPIEDVIAASRGVTVPDLDVEEAGVEIDLASTAARA